MADRYKIRNWEKFQHYKNKTPIWIKLYTNLLNDKNWFLLSGEDCKTLVMLWILASKTDGILPPTQDVAFCLRTTEQNIEECLKRLTNWVVNVDSRDPLEGGYTNSSLDKSRVELELELELDNIESCSRVKNKNLTDEQFWEKLKKNPAYKDLNFEIENGKMDAWLLIPKNKHRRKTRQFIINWLNNAASRIQTVQAPAQQRSRAKKVVL